MPSLRTLNVLNERIGELGSIGHSPEGSNSAPRCRFNLIMSNCERYLHDSLFRPR